MAKKNPNSQLCTNNTPARKQLLTNIGNALADSQPSNIIKINLVVQQQLPSKVTKKKTPLFEREKIKSLFKLRNFQIRTEKDKRFYIFR